MDTQTELINSLKQGVQDPRLTKKKIVYDVANQSLIFALEFT